MLISINLHNSSVYKPIPHKSQRHEAKVILTAKQHLNQKYSKYYLEGELRNQSQFSDSELAKHSLNSESTNYEVFRKNLMKNIAYFKAELRGETSGQVRLLLVTKYYTSDIVYNIKFR